MKTQKEIAENERATWNNNSNKKYYSEEEIRTAINKCTRNACGQTQRAVEQFKAWNNALNLLKDELFGE